MASAPPSRRNDLTTDCTDNTDTRWFRRGGRARARAGLALPAAPNWRLIAGSLGQTPAKNPSVTSV